jgi:hypothetical protein
MYTKSKLEGSIKKIPHGSTHVFARTTLFHASRIFSTNTMTNYFASLIYTILFILSLITYLVPYVYFKY